MRPSFRNKRSSVATPLQINSQDQEKININSFMGSESVKSPRLIALYQIPDKINVRSQINSFKINKIQREWHHCNRKNCLHSSTERIKNQGKSSPNVKFFSPNRVDIIIQQGMEAFDKDRSPCIHSTINLNRKYHNKSKDLLQEFKQLEELRRSIKNRKGNSVSKLNFSINLNKKYKTAKMEGSKEIDPQKGNLYLQVKSKISKRYNQMFKRYSSRSKQLIKDQIDMKDLWSAKSLRINKSVQA